MLYLHRNDSFFDATESFMKAVTLRNMPSELAQAVKRRAHDQHTSINKAVISLLAESIGLLPKKRTRHHELDLFFGAWSKEKAENFDKALSAQRTIDPSLWK
jgi:hypothetical protein